MPWKSKLYKPIPAAAHTLVLAHEIRPESRQITIIPKPDLRGFGGTPVIPPFEVSLHRNESIACPLLRVSKQAPIKVLQDFLSFIEVYISS